MFQYQVLFIPGKIKIWEKIRKVLSLPCFGGGMLQLLLELIAVELVLVLLTHARAMERLRILPVLMMVQAQFSVVPGEYMQLVPAVLVELMQDNQEHLQRQMQ